jgi:hypothetical protein
MRTSLALALAFIGSSLTIIALVGFIAWLLAYAVGLVSVLALDPSNLREVKR